MGPKTVAVLSNDHVWTYNLRREILEALINVGYRVVLILPYGERVDDLINMGCEFVNITSLERHGLNPFKELKLLCEYMSVLKKIHPDVVLSYTIKPNIYGGMVCRKLRLPFIANVTGLGTTLQGQGLKPRLMTFLYKLGLKHAKTVFFQNKENAEFMIQRHLVKNNYDLLPGSGVNLQQHPAEAYPDEADELIFVTIGRVMKDKGTHEILAAAKAIKKQYPEVRFKLIGAHDGDCAEAVSLAEQKGLIEYLGPQKNVHEFIKNSHAIIHASYHEGMANVLLESAAAARPVIATDISGCRETFDEAVSGIGCKVRDADDLIRAIKQFIELSHTEKEMMGKAGRKKMEQEFDRKIVVKKYLAEIEKIIGE